MSSNAHSLASQTPRARRLSAVPPDGFAFGISGSFLE